MGLLPLPVVRAELGPNGAAPLLEKPAGAGPVLNPQSWGALLPAVQEGREGKVICCDAENMGQRRGSVGAALLGQVTGDSGGMGRKRSQAVDTVRYPTAGGCHTSRG